MSFPAINSPEPSQSQPKKTSQAKPSNKALAFIGAGVVAFGGILALAAFSGGQDTAEPEKKAKKGGQSKREAADEGKNKVMSEMGRKGAQKRWAKEKAKKEKEKEEDETEDK